MRQLFVVGIVAALATLCSIDARAQEKKKEEPKLEKVAPCCQAGHSYKHLDGRPIVFVANGISGSTVLSDNLMEVSSELRLGLRIQMVPWTRHNAMFQDLRDEEAQLQAATRIACTIAAIRKECPHVPIFLAGHSAGARVVLAAAEMSPENSIDRVFTFAAAVSCGYELTGVLKASRGGVENFYSSEDGVLDAALYHGALADGTRTAAAGQVGFRAPTPDPKDVARYCRVRNYRWNETLAGSGGHYAWVLRPNLRKVVVPLFCAENVSFEPPVEVRKMPPAK